MRFEVALPSSFNHRSMQYPENGRSYSSMEARMRVYMYLRDLQQSPNLTFILWGIDIGNMSVPVVPFSF